MAEHVPAAQWSKAKKAMFMATERRMMNLLSTRLNHGVLRGGLAAALIGAAASTASAQWTVINLHPAGTIASVASGVGSGQQVGYAQVGPTVGHFRASLWSGTAASWVNLHPTGMGYSIGYGADGGQQVGEYYPDGFPRAALWNGTAGSWVDLHPAGPSQSSALGVGGGQQVGRTYLGGYHAALWTGTAASWVDLNIPPTGGYGHSSEARGAGGGQQVGYLVAVGGVISASLWSGTAASWVNLHPVGEGVSDAYGTDGVQQVGMVRNLAATMISASVWSGSAASWVSLQPAGSISSIAYGVGGGKQVGRALVGGMTRASLWSGTAASWVDLHSFLPAGFTFSEARSITTDGINTYIAGSGFNGSTGRTEAVMWVGAAPAFCAGDFNGDNAVTNADTPAFIAALLAGGACPAPPANCLGDFNADGIVNGADMPAFFAKILAGGACP
jgi:hypothetical protein